MAAAKMRNFSARVQPDNSRVRNRVEHGKINSVCTRAYVARKVSDVSAADWLIGSRVSVTLAFKPLFLFFLSKRLIIF